MIESFKDSEMRNSGIVYNSTLEQIKQMFMVDRELAGELAISAIELVLTGDISSDDMMINMMLQPMRKINENNHIKYDNKVESAKEKRKIEMKLDKIAALANAGLRQREIGEKLGLSQQMVSYRMSVIKSSYPELLNGSPQITNNLQTNQHFTKDFTNNTKEIQNFCENVCKNEEGLPPESENFTNTLQTNQIFTKDFTNDTKEKQKYKQEMFVKNSVCKMPEVVEEKSEKIVEESKWDGSFVF